MLLDDRLEFIDGFVIPAAGTALAGDVIDLQNVRDIGSGEDIYWFIATEVAAAGGTSIQANLIVSDTSNMGSPVVIMATPVITLAQLNAGRLPFLGALPVEGMLYKRYLGIQLVVVGTFSAGQLCSGLMLDKNARKLYAEGQN